MIGYTVHRIDKVTDASTVSKTIRLNAGTKRVLGVLAVMPDAYSDPSQAMDTRIGLKYNGVEVLPRGFSLGLLLHSGYLPMRDAMLQTPFETVEGTENGISIDVEISGNGHVPSVDLYFATES